MEIILLEDIASLGNLGDIVVVKDGYARNYLIPYHKAKRKTEKNLQEFAEKKNEYEKRRSGIVSQANTRFALLHEKSFEIKMRAGIDGKLFGSVSALDIVNLIKPLDSLIKKSEVKLVHPIKTLGEFDIDIVLHNNVKAAVKIAVVAEE